MLLIERVRAAADRFDLHDENTQRMGAVNRKKMTGRECYIILVQMPVTTDPRIMGGKPCIEGTRVTVGVVLGLIASGRTNAEILVAYPYLSEQSIKDAIEYAAWRMQEQEVALR